MVYHTDNIIADVRCVMDMNPQDESLLGDGDVDTLSFNRLIHSKIEEAAYSVEMEAPLCFLDSGSNMGESAIYWNTVKGHEGTGWLVLPKDFIRLVVFRMSDWERPVYQAIDESSPIYARQSSVYAGVRGNASKPVVAIVKSSSGRVLEFYSCKDNQAEIEQAVYLRRPQIDGDGGIELCERCYKAILYYAAGLTQSSLGNMDMAKMMFETSKSLIAN